MRPTRSKIRHKDSTAIFLKQEMFRPSGGAWGERKSEMSGLDERKNGGVRALFFALFLVSPAHAGALDKLHRFLETTQTVSADFAQIVVAKDGRRPRQSTWTMLIARPGKFRWQIEKPYLQLLVGDGERVWMYDPDLRQATVRKFDAALGGTPAALLAGTNALENGFELRELETREGLEWLEARPKSPDGGFERLQLGFAGDDLKAMELFDNFGQTTSLVFFNLLRNPPLPDTRFGFVPPAGIDVIGE